MPTSFEQRQYDTALFNWFASICYAKLGLSVNKYIPDSAGRLIAELWAYNLQRLRQLNEQLNQEPPSP